MKLPRASLGLKLNLALIAFFIVLGVATAGLLLNSFNRTQSNATSTSEEGLEEFGSKTLSAFSRLVGEGVGLQFERSAQNARVGAEYLVKSRGNIGTDWDASRLVPGTDGVLYDPSADRLADFWIPPFLTSPEQAESRLETAAYLGPLFPGLLENVPDALAVYFVGADGELTYYPPIGVQDYLEPDVRLWQEAHFDTVLPEANPDRKTVWVSPYDDLAKQGKLVSVLAPVYFGDEFFGAVGLDLSLDAFISQVDDTNPTANGYAFYVDSAGNLLPTNHSPAVAAAATAEGNEGLAGALDQMRAGEGGLVRTTIDGTEVVVAFAPVPSLGGTLALVSPVTDLLDEAQAGAVTTSIQEEGNRTLRVTLVAMGALFVCGLMGATYLNRRVLVRPIEAMVSATRSVASGDLDTSLPVETEDELGMLAASFNQMTSDLRQRRDALQQEVADREAAQNELAALFAAMTDRVVVLDDQGRFLRVPQTGGTRMLNDPSPLEGMMVSDVRPKDVADTMLTGVRDALASGNTATIEISAGDLPEGRRWLSAAVIAAFAHLRRCCCSRHHRTRERQPGAGAPGGGAHPGADHVAHRVTQRRLDAGVASLARAGGRRPEGNRQLQPRLRPRGGGRRLRRPGHAQ